MTGGHMQLAHRGPASNIVQISEHKVQLGRCSYRSIWTVVVDNVTLRNKITFNVKVHRRHKPQSCSK